MGFMVASDPSRRLVGETAAGRRGSCRRGVLGRLKAVCVILCIVLYDQRYHRGGTERGTNKAEAVREGLLGSSRER